MATAPLAADDLAMSSDPSISYTPLPIRDLRRCDTHRMVAGVAAGIGEHFDLDPLLVRIAFVVLAAAGGLGVPLYLAMWLLVPAGGSLTSIAEDLVSRYQPKGLR